MPAQMTDTAERILDIAQELIQTRGFNAFSYKDIAQAIGIRPPSIHHHFPTKADLAAAVVRQYRERFLDTLTGIRADRRRALDRLSAYTELFRRTLETDGRLCLCGMLSAELASLPPAVVREVQSFFQESEDWLSAVLAEGRDSGELRFPGHPDAKARLFLATLEGGMILARGRGDRERFRQVSTDFLKELGAK